MNKKGNGTFTQGITIPRRVLFTHYHHLSRRRQSFSCYPPPRSSHLVCHRAHLRFSTTISSRRPCQTMTRSTEALPIGLTFKEALKHILNIIRKRCHLGRTWASRTILITIATGKLNLQVIGNGSSCEYAASFYLHNEIHNYFCSKFFQ